MRYPLIFYCGHTAVFFINKLNVANLIDTRIDLRLESTMAVGVDEMSWDDHPREDFPESKTTALLVGGNERFDGIREIRHHLEDLRRFKTEWDTFQSDACYCDNEGKAI